MTNKKLFHFHIILIIIINILNLTPTLSYWKSWQLQTQDLSILLTKQQIYVYAYITGIIISLIGIVIKFILQNLLSQWIKKNISTFQIIVKIIQSFSLSIIIGSMFYHNTKDNFLSQFTQQNKSYIVFAVLIVMYYVKQVQYFFKNKNNPINNSKYLQYKKISQKVDDKSGNLDILRIEKIEKQNQDSKHFTGSNITNEQFINQMPISSQQLSSSSDKHSFIENHLDTKKNSSNGNSYLFGQILIKIIQFIWIGAIIGQSFSTGHYKYYFHNIIALFFYQLSVQIREQYIFLENQLNLENDQKLKNIYNGHFKQSFLRKKLKYKLDNLFIFVGVLIGTIPYVLTKLSYEHVIASFVAYQIYMMGLLQAQCFKLKKTEDYLVLIPQMIGIILGTIVVIQIQEIQPIQPDHWHIYSPSIYK